MLAKIGWHKKPAKKNARDWQRGSDRLLCEELEPRVTPTTDLGTLDIGRLYLPNQTMKGSFSGTGETKYTFTVPDAHVDIYLSFSPLLEEPLPGFDLNLEGVASTVGDKPFNTG